MEQLNTKRCSHCQEHKLVAEFYTNPSTKDGLHHYCKPCARAASKKSGEKNPEKKSASYRRWAAEPANKAKRAKYLAEWNRQHPEAKPASERKYRHGISYDEYQSKLQAQGGTCFICRQVNTRKDRDGRPHSLAVDHSHKTGELRDLLCNACNTSLGQIERFPEAFIAYLRKWSVLV